jgi:imidazolonepropionase-like amidohydrolase
MAGEVGDDRRDERIPGETEPALSDLHGWIRRRFAPATALTAATNTAAEAFRVLDRGRIEPGRRADLLLVGGNPTLSITATRGVLKVWRGGIELPRAASVR